MECKWILKTQLGLKTWQILLLCSASQLKGAPPSEIQCNPMLFCFVYDQNALFCSLEALTTRWAPSPYLIKLLQSLCLELFEIMTPLLLFVLAPSLLHTHDKHSWAAKEALNPNPHCTFTMLKIQISNATISQINRGRRLTDSEVGRSMNMSMSWTQVDFLTLYTHSTWRGAKQILYSLSSRHSEWIISKNHCGTVEKMGLVSKSREKVVRERQLSVNKVWVKKKKKNS